MANKKYKFKIPYLNEKCPECSGMDLIHNTLRRVFECINCGHCWKKGKI